MKLISWNVNRRTGKRIQDQMKALGEISPDIVALQEVTFESVPDYLAGLERQGYHEARESSMAQRRVGGPAE